MARVVRTLLVAAALAAACDRPEPLPETPRLEPSARRVELTAPDGGYDADPVQVTVASVGGPLAVTGVSTAYADGAGWLSAELVGDPTSSPATVLVRTNRARLPSGTYRATVWVAATGVVNSPLGVPVTLVVPPPRLAVSTEYVHLDGPMSHLVYVANAGGGVLEEPRIEVQYYGGSGWLHPQVWNGYGGDPAWPLYLEVIPSAIQAAGSHLAVLTIRAPGVAEPGTVRLYMTVAPALRPSAPRVRFDAEAGGVPAPTTVTFTPDPPGVTPRQPTVTVQSSTCGAWLDADLVVTTAPYQGTLSPTAAVAALAAGTSCTATVRLGAVVDHVLGAPPEAPSGAVAVYGQVEATLRVRDSVVRPVVLVSQPNLRFGAIRGGADPAAQVVTITEALGGELPPPLRWHSAPWLSSTLYGSAPPYTLRVEPRVAGLAAGTHRGEVTIGSGESGDRVSVEVVVEDWRRAGHAEFATGLSATALPDGKVLVAGGRSFLSSEGWGRVHDLPAELGEAPAPVGSEAWHMRSARTRHTATALQGGEMVVAAGGVDPGTSVPVGTWELYDFEKHNWTVLRPLVTARFAHTGTALADGRVLLAGGAGGTEWAPIALADVEIVDPAVGRSAPAASMTTKRRDASAVRLADGRVLVAGGRGENGAALASAEVFDPALGTWSATGGMGQVRSEAALVLLDDGRVLAAGGTDGERALASAEIYDPAFGVWTPTSSMATARVAPAVKLPGGRVLVVGGAIGVAGAIDVTGSVERYDPWTASWSSAGDLHEPRAAHAVTIREDGLVVVAGGTSAVPATDRTIMSDVEVGTGEAP